MADIYLIKFNAVIKTLEFYYFNDYVI